MSVDKTFVNAMCISRQKYLLGKEKLVRMADAATFDEAYKLLIEYGFGEGDVAPAQYERMLGNRWCELLDFARRYAPSAAVLAYCVAPVDFYNAEVLVRAQYTSLSAALQEGLVSLDKLRKGVKGAYNLLPSYLVQPIRQAVDLFERNQATGVAVSTVFARGLYAYLLQVCRHSPMLRYVRWQIDTKNISVALRSNSAAELDSMMIEGGTMSQTALYALQKGDRTVAERAFVQTPYADVVRMALDARDKQQPLVDYENAVDSAFLRSLYPRRYDSDGLAPFLLYYGYSVNDIANVRIILSGKLASATPDRIKARLRVSYGQ